MSANRFAEIRDLPLFSRSGDEAFAALVRGAYVQNFPPQTELITEGDPADFFHIIVSGSVELFSKWEGRETCITFLGPHATFILAATIKDRPYLMSARTLRKSRIILVPSQDVRDVFERDSEFAKAIVGELAGCYRETVKITKNLKLRTSVERLANFIVKHSENSPEEDQFTLGIEKKKLASFLGMTPENLSRAFAALKNHGVDVDGQTIVVERPGELRAFAKPYALIDD